MVQLGRDGYRRYAEADLRDRRRHAGRRAVPPRAADHGRARRSASRFTSDEFDIYHVNDFMKQRGWRFNGQQYPNAIHMAVTRPQTQPGVAEAFATDLADAVAYGIEHKDEQPHSAAIYGGVAGGLTDEADEFIRVDHGRPARRPDGPARVNARVSRPE